MKKEKRKTNDSSKKRAEQDTIEAIYSDFILKNGSLDKEMAFSVVGVHLMMNDDVKKCHLKGSSRRLFSIAEGDYVCVRIRSKKNYSQICAMWNCYNNVSVRLANGYELRWLSSLLHKTDDEYEFCIVFDMNWHKLNFKGFTQVCLQVAIGNDRTALMCDDIYVCCAGYKVTGKRGTLSFLDAAGRNKPMRSRKCFNRPDVSVVNVCYKCGIRLEKMGMCEVEFRYFDETGKQMKVSVPKAEAGDALVRTSFCDHIQVSEWKKGRYDVYVYLLGELLASGYFVLNEKGQKSVDAAVAVEVLATKCAALEKLDTMVGLGEVKQIIRRNTNYMKLMSLRHRAGLPTTGRILNMILCGGPGTGKTTVARLIGEILADIGILSKGHLCECNRESLIDNVVGGTEKRTMEIIEKSAGGVLFIDEAYSLMDSGSGCNDFGQRVIDTLMPVLSDNNDRIVILAGYEKEINKLLRTNPGLASRFPIYMRFPDYTVEELEQMANNYFAVNEYSIGEQTALRIHKVFEKAVRVQTFGAGRFVHTFIENMVLPAMATRLLENMKGTVLSKQKMKTILPQDIPEPEVVLAQMGLGQPASPKIGFS